MANRTRFAGLYNALDFNYGGSGSGTPGPLQVLTRPTATGAGTVTLNFGQVTLSDGTTLAPLSTNAPINIGGGSNAEIVTPSAVSNPTPGVYGSATVTATFANVHTSQESVASGTFGLQEAINAAAAAGGGTVIVDAAWASSGGTNAMIAAATIPAGVGIFDNRTGHGGVATYTVTIANAQVLTNNTVPTAVLPIPGATSMWDIVDAVVENKNTGVAYTGGGIMAFYYGTSSAGVLASGTIAATFLTSPTVAHVIKVAGALADTAASSILNKGVVFANPTADFAAGTGTLILKGFGQTPDGDVMPFRSKAQQRYLESNSSPLSAFQKREWEGATNFTKLPEKVGVLTQAARKRAREANGR